MNKFRKMLKRIDKIVDGIKVEDIKKTIEEVERWEKKKSTMRG